MTSSPKVVEYSDRIALLNEIPRLGVGAEIGVQAGDFAAQLLSHCQPRLLFLVDGWRYRASRGYKADKSNVEQLQHDAFYNRVCVRFRPQMDAGQIVILRSLSGECLPMLPDHFLDWAYLDADHSYEAVLSDLTLLDKKVKVTGVIAGHDYVEDDEQNFGVIRAVDDFCRRSNWRMTARTRDDQLCDGYDSYVLSNIAACQPANASRQPLPTHEFDRSGKINEARHRSGWLKPIVSKLKALMHRDERDSKPARKAGLKSPHDDDNSHLSSMVVRLSQEHSQNSVKRPNAFRLARRFISKKQGGRFL